MKVDKRENKVARQFIQEHYLKMTDKQIGSILGVDKLSVAKMRKRMGIKREYRSINIIPKL